MRSHALLRARCTTHTCTTTNNNNTTNTTHAEGGQPAAINVQGVVAVVGGNLTQLEGVVDVNTNQAICR